MIIVIFLIVFIFVYCLRVLFSGGLKLLLIVSFCELLWHGFGTWVVKHYPDLNNHITQTLGELFFALSEWIKQIHINP
jgi:hypothetical protein